MPDVKLPDGRIIKNVPEGTTRTQLMSRLERSGAKPIKAQAQTPQQKESLGRTVLDQTLQGATFGFADEITDIGASAVASLVTGKGFKETLEEARGLTSERQARQFEQRPGATIASQLAGGVLTGGAATTTKAGAAIGSSLRAGGAGARIAKGAGVGAASLGAFGVGTAEEGERISGGVEGLATGAIIGAALPIVGVAATGVKGAVVPKIDEALKPLVQRARDLGIPLRADQVSPTKARKTVQKISQEIPFSGADEFETAQRLSFNKAVARTIGQEAEDLGPETITKFIDDASIKFNSILTGEPIEFGESVVKRLNNIKDEAAGTITKDLANVVNINVNKLSKDIQEGVISGEKLASFRTQLINKIPKAQPGAKQFLGDIVELIDDVAEKSISPEKAEILKTARREWRNFKTIEPLLEEATDGLINPTKLLTRVKASKFIKASRKVTGEDELVDLARIGKQLLPKAGGSDTFQKSALSAGAVGLLGATVANPLLGASLAVKAGVGIAGNRALQAVATNQRLIDAALKTPAKKQLQGGITSLTTK